MLQSPLLALAVCLALPATAQEPAQDIGQDEPQQDVEQRLRELERKNAELEGRLAVLEPVDDEPYIEDDYNLGLQVQYGDVGATLQVYGEVGFEYANPEPPNQGHSSFFLGSLDFMLNMRFGDYWRALSETVIEGKTDDEVQFSQERLWGAWVPEDWFYVKFGTEHNPISRWNQLYHHGGWLETSINRPLLAAFEGGMGVLPMHRTGVMVGGTAFGDAGRYEYFATVSNGRGPEPTNKQRTDDVDDHKAIDVGIAFEPFAESDWRFGVAAVVDKIPQDTSSANPQRQQSMDETIYTAQVEWRNGPYFALGEFAYIDHEGQINNTDYDSNVSYLQLEYTRGDWTPYTRFDYRNMNESDPFYEGYERGLDLWLATLGVRIDVATNVAVKFESAYGRGDHEGGSGDIDERSVLFFGVQLAWWL